MPAGALPVSPRSNLRRQNQIQRPGLEDTGSAGVFVKEPLGILSIDPQSKTHSENTLSPSKNVDSF
jgi:hypothetical protein